MSARTIPVTPAGVTRRGRIAWEDGAGNREFSPEVQRRVLAASWVALGAFGLLALYCVLAVALGLPVAPWSPVGLERAGL